MTKGRSSPKTAIGYSKFGIGNHFCLGANLARGYPLCEAVLGAYAAFAMQSVAIDERDPAGVMNHEAACWWQQNAARIPLSTVPFLEPEVL